MIEPDKRSLFNKKIAEEKYKEFQTREIDDSGAIEDLRSKIAGNNVLVLGPGPSISKYKNEIEDIVKKENCVTISVSFVPSELECDYTFLSNLKRYNTTFNPSGKQIKLIHTSNIAVEIPNSLVINYSNYINEDDVIMDNTAMMLLNLLARLKPNRVYLAGLDGYNLNTENYYQERLKLPQDVERMISMNESISLKIADIRKVMDIEFVTPSKYNQ
jgi:4-hydroxy 2-oxovalerate aldolase